jgi:hypothetical protein
VKFQNAKDYLLTAALGVIFVWHGTQLQKLSDSAADLSKQLVAIATSQKHNEAVITESKTSIAELRRSDAEQNIKIEKLDGQVQSNTKRLDRAGK